MTWLKLFIFVIITHKLISYWKGIELFKSIENFGVLTYFFVV